MIEDNIETIDTISDVVEEMTTRRPTIGGFRAKKATNLPTRTTGQKVRARVVIAIAVDHPAVQVGQAAAEAAVLRVEAIKTATLQIGAGTIGRDLHQGSSGAVVLLHSHPRSIQPAVTMMQALTAAGLRRSLLGNGESATTFHSEKPH